MIKKDRTPARVLVRKVVGAKRKILGCAKVIMRNRKK
jgi:hypothetical protein